MDIVPALYAVHRADRLTYGIGVYSYLGLSIDSGNQWAGRRVIEQAGIATLNIAPAIAWAATDRLTLGVSVAAQLLDPTARLAVANDATYYGPPVGLPDGQLELSGQSWEAGGQLGLTYALTPGSTIGLAWTAPVDHVVAFDIATKNLHPVLAALLPPDQAAKLDVTLPRQLLLGLSHQADDDTTLAVGLPWQDWSAFGDAKLKLPGYASPMTVGGLQDTWRVRAELSVLLQGTADVEQFTHPLPLPGIPPLAGTYTDTRVYMLAVAADFVL